MNETQQPPRFNIAAYIATLLTIVVAAAVYYFAFALPKYNEDRLKLERQKFQAEQQVQNREDAAQQTAQEKVAHEKHFRQQQLEAALRKADEDYWEYVRINGGYRDEYNPEVWHATRDVFDRAEEKRAAAKAEAFARWGDR